MATFYFIFIMPEFIIFQTKANVWLVTSECYNDYIKEKKYNPIRILIRDLEEDIVEWLFDILEQDKAEFGSILMEELDVPEYWVTIYSN